MSQIGRQSRIKGLHYQDEVDYLLSQGHSYQTTADIINSRYPENPRINKDTIFRYVKGHTKQLRSEKEISIQELLNDTFDEIYYKIKISSLPANERRALIEDLLNSS